MKRLVILTINLALSQVTYSLDFRCGNARVQDADALKDFIALESRVYDQSLLYLEAFVERLSQPSEFCPMGAMATIEGAPNNTKACIFDQAQIPKIIEQSRQIISEPAAFRDCFVLDNTLSGQYAASLELVQQSEIAGLLDRPLMSDYFAQGGFSTELTEAGDSFSKNFVKIISNIVPTEQYLKYSFHALKDLWATAGWSPMYVDRTENSLDSRFKGSYVYAKIIGPDGMLDVATINGEPYALHLGMTVQAADSLYPFHYHGQEEIYLDISDPACLSNKTYALFDWQEERYQQVRDNAESVRVTLADEQAWDTRFGNPALGELRFLKSYFFHSFNVAQTCSGAGPQGLVSVWARTGINLGASESKTRVCELPTGAEETAKPQNFYLCEVPSLIGP